MALKNSQRTYKHEVLKQMREEGQLDGQIYAKIKNNQNAVKREDVVPRAFPSKAEEMKNPPNALKTGNALYATSNMGYGGC